MFLIYTAFTLLFIWVSVAGVTILSQRFIADTAIAKSFGLLSVTLVFFFIEHFIGLGDLHWLMPVVVGGSAWLLYKKKVGREHWGFWRAEMVFVSAFLYGFAWRYAFPAISPSSERLTDLFFITNYIGGDKLPPVDHWNPPHLFDYYYGFQHYAAALLGRVLNLDVGVTYQVAFALLMALPITLAWSISRHYIQSFSLRLLLICTLAFGGTGLSPILHLALQSPEKPANTATESIERYNYAVADHSRSNIIGGVRLIGGSLETSMRQPDYTGVTLLANLLLPSVEREGGQLPMVLPAENYGYQFFLGDYHPTLGGFFLLILALAIMTSVERGLQARLGQGMLTALVPVMMITNTWTFPLLVLLLGGWIGHRLLTRNHLDWIALIGGGVIGTFLIYPFLADFTANSLPTPIKLVAGDLHTPLSRFLALHWPLLFLLAAALFIKTHRRFAWGLVVTWGLLLVMTEFVYVDDPTGGIHERTNSTMKWWGWIQTGALVSLGALCLGATQKWIRWSTIAVMLAVNLVAVDLIRYYFLSARYYQGDLAGHSWYTNDATNREMFELLSEAPAGVVLERVINGAYSNTSIFGVFSAKPVLLGWPAHLLTWHGEVPRIWNLRDEISDFYAGKLDNPLTWLAGNDVRYIVFTQDDDTTQWQAIDTAIQREYAWHEFSRNQARHTGIWVRIQ